MNRVIFLILVVLLLNGCTLQLKTSAGHDHLMPDEQSFWQLTIGDENKPIFSGILALGYKNNVIDVVLLDSTGIKLLSEKITSDGKIELVSVMPPLGKKGLPDFLGTGLYRIFNSENENWQSPCFQDFLVRKCYGENDDGMLLKVAGIGPFRLWSARYFIYKNNEGNNLAGVRLKQGWFKPEMTLKRMNL